MAAAILPRLAADSGLSGGDSRPTVIVGSEDDYPPYCLVDERGLPMGFSVELITEALDVMGRQPAFVTGSWEEVKNALIDATVQALPLVGRTPEREDLFDFTFPYLTRYGTMVVRKDTPAPQEYTDLAGKTIGVMRGDNAEEYVRRKGLVGEVVATETFEEALFLLARGEIDAVVMQQLLAYQLTAQEGLESLQVGPALLNDFKQSFCFAVTKGDRELWELLNEGLAITMANGTFDRLQIKWFTPSVSPGRGLLVIGGDENYPPYEYLDENGQPAGFNVDLTRAIAEEMGLDVEIRLGPWNTIFQELQDGRIDMVQGLFYSPERDRTLSFSQPHSVVDHVLVTRKESPVPDDLSSLPGLSLLVMEGDISQEFLTREYPGVSLILAGSQEEALLRLSRGEGDAALTARIPAYYWLEKDKLKSLEVGSRSYLSGEYNYGALEQNYRLIQAFTQGLSSLKATGRYHTISSKWLGVYEEHTGITWEDLRRLLLFALLPLTVVFAAWFLWSRSLKLQVNQRTAELHAMSEHLREREAHFRNLFENLSSGMALFQIGEQEEDFVITDLNPAEENLRGLIKADVMGKKVADVYPVGEKTALLQAVRRAYITGEPQILPITGNRNGLLNKWIETRVFRLPSGQIAALSDDRTEQKKAEEKLHQMEKMESIGQLAGGIAHDFNNQLSGILGYTELLLGSVREETSRRYLENIRQGAQNGAQLTRQLLSFARKGVSVVEALNVDDILDEVVDILEHTIDKRIEIHRESKANHPVIKGDGSQLKNALLNIAINARDALPGQGTISFQTSYLTVRETDPSQQELELAPGTYLNITITDTGCGMDEAVKNQIFEPFFTTKGVGKGTGMGLSAAYGSVKNHGGTIQVETAPGKGSSFRVLLPCPPPVQNHNRPGE